MNIYKWDIICYPKSGMYLSFATNGGYVVAKDSQDAYERVAKNFSTQGGYRIQLMDMGITSDEMRTVIESEEKVVWTRFYGDQIL